MKCVIQTLTIIILFATFSFAFYPDSAYIMGHTHTWIATGEASGNRVSVRDVQGYIHAVYCYQLGLPYADSSEIFYVYSTDNGLTWSTPENVSRTDTCVSFEPNIAIDSQGRLHCVWKQFYDDTSTTYHDYDMYYSQNSGAGWTPAVNISNIGLGANGCYSSMVIDTQDHVHVVYDMSTGGGNWDIFYSYYNDTVWSIPYQISNTPYDDAFPAMTIDQNDHLHVVWRQNTGNAPIYYTKYDGNTWSTPVIITNFTSGQSAFPCVVVDSNNYPRVAWSWSNLPTNASEIYYTAYDGVSWSPPLNISSTANFSEELSLAIDSLDQLYVVWMENTPLFTWDVYYRTHNGSTWSAVVNLTQDSSFSYCPKLGNPVKGNKVDLIWVDSWVVRAVMYMGLNLTGIAEETNAECVRNHFSHETIFQGPLHLQNNHVYKIYDITGRQIHTINPAPGIYFIEVDGEIRQKIIKIK